MLKNSRHPLMLVACFAVIIGALNWLFIGLGMGNPVQMVAGSFSNWVYIFVGLCGLLFLSHKVLWLTKK